MLAQIFRWRALEVGHVGLERLPVLVHAPAERRHPAEARLDHHDLELRIALEHAFENEAHDLRLTAGGVLGHVLDIERWPASVARRPAAGAENVDADRQPR